MKMNLAVENAHINADYMPKAQQSRRYLFDFITEQAAQARSASRKGAGLNYSLPHERLGYTCTFPSHWPCMIWIIGVGALATSGLARMGRPRSRSLPRRFFQPGYPFYEHA